ncbi:PEP-CTERM sorting domain-containing protein [Pseudoduganella lutea]|nr:PEP-CTERM sorting domain-containing protein [Pseudoduganella lutea]
MSLTVKTAVASAVLLLAAGAAQADITAYTSQSSYLSAAGTTGVDSFDDLDIEPYDGPLVRSAGDYSYELSAGPESIEVWGASDDGSDFWATPGWSGDGLTFTLSGPVNGAGGFFFGSDLFGFSTPLEAITITATDINGGTLSYTIEAPEVNSFVGFVSDVQLASLFVKGSEPGVFTTANDLHLSVSAVPEPSTYAMMLAGLGLAGFAARRQRKS